MVVRNSSLLYNCKCSIDISQDGVVSRASPFTKKEGSGTAPLLELFCWNAINITRATYFYASLGHCGDKPTAHRACMQAARPGALLHVWFTLTYRGHAAATKICIFMFPRISGEKNNLSNDAVPDPSFFVKGWLARLRKCACSECE